eukprot:9509191-Alexandrium_andersonii.AAC.1
MSGLAPPAAVVPAAVLRLVAAGWIKLERKEELSRDEEDAVVTYMEIHGLCPPRRLGSEAAAASD